MPTEDELTVWSSMLDGKYMVKVTRIAPYRGELTIADGDNVLHRKAVLLSFNALFGPDVRCGYVAGSGNDIRRQAVALVEPRTKCALATHTESRCGALGRTGFGR